MKLDDFTLAYIEAALWATSATDDTTGDEYESLESFDLDDLDDATLASMVEDCREFQADHAGDLERAARRGDYANGRYTPAERAGHDFWLTRNHHGAGFWDRGLGKVGERLTEAAQAYGESYAWIENGKVFFE